MSYRSFEDLEVWKRSMTLCENVYQLLSECKDWGFRDQLQRAVISIPSNIAEGSERSSKAEFRQFLSYAKGSCGEVRTQIMLGVRIGYLAANSEKLVAEATELSKMLHGLIKSLE
jgi:four helix bundle protein